LSLEKQIQFFSGGVFQICFLGFGFQQAGFQVLVFFIWLSFLRWHNMRIQ